MPEEIETIRLNEYYFLVVDNRDKSKHLMGYDNQVYPFHYINRLKKYFELIEERPEIEDYSVPLNYQ